MGLVASSISQSLPPKAQFSVDQIPDMTGKVVIVTGANTGVGKETAKALLAKNAKVYLAARSSEKAQNAIEELKAATGKEGIFLQLDLADLHAIKQAAAEFTSKEKVLHILFNNAGVMNPPVPQVTAQNYDMQFGTNVLGHFYLTKLLLPTMIATAAASGDDARIVNTSSMASLRGNIDFNCLKDGPARRRRWTIELYAQSKLGNVILSNELARRYGSQGVISAAVNPGNLRTELWRHGPAIMNAVLGLFLYPPPMGALTQLWAGTTDAGRELNGKYLIPWARVGEPNPLAKDEKLGAELWEWMEEQVRDI